MKAMEESIVVKGAIARRLKENAKKLDVSLEEYLLDLLIQALDPRKRAREYVKASEELLAEARRELEGGDVRQAAEKVWGAAALAVKAYASWRDGRRLTSHGELWEYKSIMAEDLGSWVRVAFQQASSMHTCFYEDWCDRGDVEEALKAVEKLVRETKQRILREGSALTETPPRNNSPDMQGGS